MSFRKRGCKTLLCNNDSCKVCAWAQSLSAEGMILCPSWSNILATPHGEYAVFHLQDTKGRFRKHILLRYDEVYLVHLWNDEKTTHGLTALHKANKHTLADIARITDDQLMQIEGFGVKSLKEVHRIQERFLGIKHPIQLDLVLV